MYLMLYQIDTQEISYTVSATTERAMRLLSPCTARLPETQGVADPEEPIHPRVQLRVQSEFQAPLDVRLLRLVMLRTLVALSHDQSLSTTFPFNVTLETWLGTPITVTLPRGFVSA